MTAVDRRWSQAMLAITSEPLDRAALAFDRCGRGAVRGATLGAVGLALARRRRWSAMAAFAAAEAATPLAVNAVKLVVDRARPAGARVDPFGTSFPSGHAAYAGATGAALVLLASGRRRPRPALWLAAAAGAAGMAWSRTYLQAHWLTDVTAGALLGGGVSLATFAIVRRRCRCGGPRRSGSST
jgi:membrane-associated phospholipid phosphatase